MPSKPVYKICEGCGKESLFKDPRSRFCSQSCGLSGERSYLWKGDAVGTDALHAYMRKHISKPEFCEHCKEVPPKDLANKSGEYKRDVSDWEWLCRRCHMKSDGRLDSFLSHSNMHNKLPDINCEQCGKLFAPGKSTIRFCSQSCSTTFINLNTRVYNRTEKHS